MLSLYNFSSLLLVKIALRLGKVDLTKIINNSYNFIPEISKSTGETLGHLIWKSRSKVYEKRRLN